MSRPGRSGVGMCQCCRGPLVTRGHNRDEREQWQALTTEPRLDMLPPEALIASIRHLAGRLLDLTEPSPNDRSEP